MVEASQIASYLCSLQPVAVRSRLLHDESFGARSGLIAHEIVMLGDVHVDQQQLFAAVRQALIEKQAMSLVDVKDHGIVVKVDQEQIILELPSRGRNVLINDLMFLSPNHEERTQTVKRLIDRWGPTAPDFSAVLAKAEEHELGGDNVRKLFAEGATGVAALQSRATSALKNNQATLEHLVPNSLVYFERFCGPAITGSDHEEYFRSVLSQYRKDLIRRDLMRGLDICLQGALRDDLMPGVWTSHIDDDELWEALTACDPWANPFSLLGALDIAISRQHDERCRTFAEEAVQKLVQEQFPRPDGVDTYELLPLLAELVLNRINGLEGGLLRPPCWKRMCAWMQAGFLARLMQSISLELESFREWIHGNQTLAGVYAKTLDLRYEPMYRAAEMSSRALREEVIGRLMILYERHRAAGRPVPGSDIILQAMARLTDQGSLGWALPGPLDGHRRPAATGASRLPEDDIRRVKEELANHPVSPVLSTLAYLSQYFELGEDLLMGMREAITRSPFGREEIEFDERIGRLIDAGLVACAQRDEGLASAIASTLVAMADSARSGSHSIGILRALLIAGAAFQNEDAWAGWLEKQLADVASRLPAGGPSKKFLAHLQELKKVLKLTLRVHARAEALASAAN